MLTMLVKMGRRVDFHFLRIDAGIGSRSQDFLPILSTKRSTSLADITLNFVNSTWHGCSFAPQDWIVEVISLDSSVLMVIFL